MAQKKSSPVKKAAKTAPKAKKQPAKKAPAAKSSATGDAKKALIGQLMAVCKNLDEAAISALVRQGDALLQSKKAREAAAKKAAEKAQKAAEKTQKAAARPSSIPTRTVPMDKFSIDVTEGSDGSYFMIGINKYRIFMARDEMKKLVKICHLASDARDAGMRMYNWFNRERGDILYNTDIEGPSDPALATIYNYMIKTYTVKK